MLFAQLRAPLCGTGLIRPEPAVPISGFFMAGHIPGIFGLGIPQLERRPIYLQDVDNDVQAQLDYWGEPITIDGLDAGEAIFSEPYVDDGLGQAGISSSGPHVLMPESGFPERDPADPTDPVLELADRRGLTTRSGKIKPFRYIVREVQPDGTGWASLVLSLHPDQTTQ